MPWPQTPSPTGSTLIPSATGSRHAKSEVSEPPTPATTNTTVAVTQSLPAQSFTKGGGEFHAFAAGSTPLSDHGLSGRRSRKYPIATKRVIRAILKAADPCANEPALVARRIVDAGFTARYDYALEALQEIHYDRWRDYDAEDPVRYYALQLRDVGLIKSSPQKIIADGTDWRFLNELKTRAEGVNATSNSSCPGSSHGCPV
jgi:hypothetical protein